MAAPRGSSPRHRLAVLPFANLGQDSTDDYLADGLTEELISSLSRLRRLRVVARTSMMTYKGTSKTISQVASELGADTVLEGSVRKSEAKLRVTVKLVDAAKDEYLWSQSYDREIDDILSVEHDIAERTVEALRPRIGIEEGAYSRPRRITSDPQAFLLYLQGRHCLTHHSHSEVKSAVEMFEKAAEIDPTFASAYAMWAQCYMFMGFFGFIQPSEGFERARPLLKMAIEIDEGLDLSHMLMGRLLMDKDWDWAGAEAEFRRAIEISPNSAEAHYRYALLLNDLDRNGEALVQVSMAEELEPLSVAVNQIAGTVLYFSGRNEDAIERLERAIEIDSRAALAHNNLGLALCHQRRADDGLAEIRRAMELDPDNAMFRADLCYAYAISGRKDEARQVLARARGEMAGAHIPPVAIAGMHACLGDADGAIEWLRKAYEEHSPYLASLKIEKWFDSLRSDSRFAEILHEVGLD